MISTTRDQMKNLKRGESFIVYGTEHIASRDSKYNSTVDEYIVYDENNDGWLETDFTITPIERINRVDENFTHH